MLGWCLGLMLSGFGVWIWVLVVCGCGLVGVFLDMFGGADLVCVVSFGGCVWVVAC